MNKFHVHSLSRRLYMRTVVWSVFLCIAIVVCAAFLGRATKNFKAALTDKPDVAIYLLLPDEELGQTKLLRDNGDTRDYYAETKAGPKMVKLTKNRDGEWEVALIEPLREDDASSVMQ